MKFTFFLVLLGCLGQLQAQQIPSKNPETFTVKASKGNAQKKIWVQLPKNYQDTDKRYPVLYVMDGQNAFEGEWNIGQTLQSTKNKVIVVGIEQQGEFQSLDEMDDFLEFIATAIKPRIDADFRTQPGSADTGLLGTGTAAMMAFYGSLQYPQTFGRIGCFSPSIGKYWQEIVNVMAKTTDFRLTHIYFLHGDSSVEAAAYIEHWVNTKRCSCKKRNKRVFVEGGNDDAKLWNEGFKKAYLWLF